MGAGVKSVPGKEKYECSLLCETNRRARGGRGRGHAAPGCSCRRGAGVAGGPPGVAAGGDISMPAARAAAVLARPRPVQSAPRSDPRGARARARGQGSAVRAPEQGKQRAGGVGGTLVPRQRAPRRPCAALGRRADGRPEPGTPGRPATAAPGLGLGLGGPMEHR